MKSPRHFGGPSHVMIRTNFDSTPITADEIKNMSNRTEIKVSLSDKLTSRLEEYCAITKESSNEVIESLVDKFLEENSDLLCVEWSALSDRFELDYEKRMDARQAFIDATETAEDSPSDDKIMEKIKEMFKSRGLDSSDEFIRYIDLDLMFE